MFIAISTTGSVDVFVARIAPSLQMRSSSVKRCFLVGEVLDDRLDHEVAFGELAEVGHGLHATEHRGALFVGELAPLHLFGERLLEAGDHRVGGRLGAAAQHHLEARLRGHFGHARPHDARAHDTNSLDGHTYPALRSPGAAAAQIGGKVTGA